MVVMAGVVVMVVVVVQLWLYGTDSGVTSWRECGEVAAGHIDRAIVCQHAIPRRHLRRQLLPEP